MNFLTLLASAYLALINSQLGDIKPVDPVEWHSFKVEHGKQYEGESVELMRQTIFAYNKHQVEQFNEKFSAESGFELGLNHLADVSELEMKSINGFRWPAERNGLPANDAKAQKFLDDILNDNSTDVPDAVDWRNVAGRVTRVKNQGQCGSCWAFAAVGALEGQEKVRRAYKNSSKIVELSEQNLVDCVTADAGCNGGLMSDALDFVKQEQGIDDEESYPYEARTGKCRFSKAKVAFSDAGSAILPSGDEQKLKEVVAKFGPVAVAIDAKSLWFQFYRHGVYYNRRCHNKMDQLDHGVLVVGYGTDAKSGDYWIVKNSWGPGYGEHGYIRMARNKNNNCGIATVATIPTF